MNDYITTEILNRHLTQVRKELGDVADKVIKGQTTINRLDEKIKNLENRIAVLEAKSTTQSE